MSRAKPAFKGNTTGATADPAPRDRSSRASATITGGAGGGTVAAVAQQLREPYRSLLSIAAPFLATVLASLWPPIFDWAKSEAAAVASRRTIRMAIRRLEAFIISQGHRLNQQDLSSETRAMIEANIAKAQRSIVLLDFAIVADHIRPGD